MPTCSKENMYAMILKTVINERRSEDKLTNKFSVQSSHMKNYNEKIKKLMIKLIYEEP